LSELHLKSWLPTKRITFMHAAADVCMRINTCRTSSAELGHSAPITGAAAAGMVTEYAGLDSAADTAAAAVSGGGVPAGAAPPAAFTTTAVAPDVQSSLAGLAQAWATPPASAAAGSSGMPVDLMNSSTDARAAAAGSARPAAAAAAAQLGMQSDVSMLSRRLQRLQLSPHKVLSVFHPPVNADVAAWALAQLSNPAMVAQLQQQLLAQDLRDTKQRNALHLAVTNTGR
jgi:hypothetical protein